MNERDRKKRDRFPWLYDPEFTYTLAWRFRYVILLWVSIFAVLIALASGGIVALNSASCSQAASRLGVSGNYRFLTGCYYTLSGGRAVPDDRWPPKYIRISGKVGH